MKNNTRILSLIFLFAIQSQSYCEDVYDAFLNSLLNESNELNSFVDENELAFSKRLGISYKDSKNKFIIGYDIPVQIKQKLNGNISSLQKQVIDHNDGYTELQLSLPSENYTQTFFFKNEKYISPLTYYTTNYSKIESEYFTFLIDRQEYFNDYSKNKLDEFVDNMLQEMNFTFTEKEFLKKEKFLYILCRDEAEIKKVTGYASRGMYIVAYDAVVSTYNTHFHEVAHGLMNYKLRSEIEPELMFFLEGFAVAVGGRGGESPLVNLELGNYLLSSGFVSLSDILTLNKFISQDATIAYNASAYVNNLLMNTLGFDRYLELYNKFSGSFDALENFKESEMNFISETELKESYGNYLLTKSIVFSTSENFIDLGKGISESDNFYGFKKDGDIFLTPGDYVAGYKSKKYEDLFPGRKYNGEKYYIKVNKDEISVYNLYSNELLCLYAKGFSLSGEEVPMNDGKYEFYIRKNVFDEDIEKLLTIND